MFVKDAEITAIFGSRGSGKSTLARRLVAGKPRLVVMDPIGDWSRALGIREARGLDTVADSFRAGRDGRIAFKTTAETAPEDLQELSRLLLRLQRPYFEDRDDRTVCLVVDEINLAYAAQLGGRLPAKFTEVCLQGRHYGIEVVAITQRPTLVHPNLRDNVSTRYVMRLEDADERAAIIARIGREHADAVNRMGDHEYLTIRKGQVEQGRNPPPG